MKALNPSVKVFETIFSYFNIDFYSPNTVFFAVGAGVALALCLILRVISGLIYYSHYSALMLFAKPIEKRSEIKKTPSSLINRCVAEYIVCGEAGSPLSGVDSIVMKNIMRMSLLGINLKAIERLCVSLEIAALGIAAVSAVISGEGGWIALIGGAYLAFKIILLFFDTETLREKLFYGISTYLNSELGKFYIPDDKAGMRIFKNELHSTLLEQASILQNAINNMNSGLSTVIEKAYGTIQQTLDAEMKKYENLGEQLKKPVEGMGGVFSKLDAAATRLEKSSASLSDSISVVGKELKAVAEAVEKNNTASQRSVENSEALFLELKDNMQLFNKALLALEAELSTIEVTQKALGTSLQSYELSLQQTTGQVGDAVGSIVEYRGKEAAQALNEAISAHVIQFQSDTARLIEKMSNLFEQLHEQNKSEMQTLLRIEESVKK